MLYPIIRYLDRVFHFPQAKAHCDVPCGIYDPITAQINALTVVRMIDLMDALTTGEEKPLLEFHNAMTRYVAVKEEHAEKAKHEIRVIWGDFIKDAYLEAYPQLPGLVHKIMQLGSKCRQSADRDHGLALVESINDFAEIFWALKGVKTKKAKAPYAPGLEMVYPDL
ncbi:MAG: superoxide dismutase, Ni [Chloroflexota bacterium]|nr:MAG: superoxide dismutase, Ni [Chloroflexota bacterium]